MPSAPASNNLLLNRESLAPHMFTCNICFRSVRDIYLSCPSANNHDPLTRYTGLRDTSTAEKSYVLPSKVWFFPDCKHLVCAEHLLGGGVPFYPAGQDPEAVCPVCFKDRLEDGVETIALPLYATKIGDLSPGIPKELFEPPNLSNGFKDSYVYNIIKFQYESLLRFAALKASETEAESKKSAGKTQSVKRVDEKHDNDDDDDAATEPSFGPSNDSEDGGSLNNAAQYISPVSIVSQSSWKDTEHFDSKDHRISNSSSSKENTLSSEEWQPYSRPKSKLFSRDSFSFSRQSQQLQRPSANASPNMPKPSRFLSSIASLTKLNNGSSKAPTHSDHIFKRPSLPIRRQTNLSPSPPHKKQKGGSWFLDRVLPRDLPVSKTPLPFSTPKIRSNQTYSSQASLSDAESISSAQVFGCKQVLNTHSHTQAIDIGEDRAQAPRSANLHRGSFKWLKRKFSEREAEASTILPHHGELDSDMPAFIGDSRITGHERPKLKSVNDLVAGRRDAISRSKSMLAVWR